MRQCLAQSLGGLRRRRRGQAALVNSLRRGGQRGCVVFSGLATTAERCVTLAVRLGLEVDRKHRQRGRLGDAAGGAFRLAASAMRSASS